MAVAAKFRFFLDVYSPAAAHEGSGRNSGWFAEAEVAHLIDRQAIDLPQSGAIDVYEYSPVRYQLL